MKFTLCVDIKRRVLYLSIGIAVFVISYYIGTVANTMHYQSEADGIRQKFNENVKDIDRNEIFLNNMGISLRMFIPALGIWYGISTGFSTGFISMTNLPPFSDLIKPFGFMEIFAYGLAISRSGILVYQFVKKKHWQSLVISIVLEIGIVTMILLVAATIEWNTIIGIVGPHHNLP